MPEKHAFVTGGSGFVGRQIIRDLTADGWTVKGLARSTHAAETVASLGATPVRGDLNDASALMAGVDGCALVIHCAAHMAMGGPYRLFHKVNVEGTQAVLDAAKAQGVARFVQISAAPVVKKSGPVEMADETWPLQEVGYSPYLKTKSIADRIVRQASGEGFAAMAVRPALIWGPDSWFVEMLRERVEAGQWRWLAGMRFPYSVVHVRNVAKAAMVVAESGGPGEAYNITDGAPVILRDFLTRLLAAHGATPGDREMPYGLAIALATAVDAIWDTFGISAHRPISRLMVRLMGQAFTVSDQKIRRELAFTNAISIDDGMTELVAQHRARAA